MDPTLEAKLRALIDKQEITELVYERARALDRHDRVGQLRAFTADATTTHQGWHGTFEEFLATRSSTSGRTDMVGIMCHFITNVLVHLDDESHARAHSYHLCTTNKGGDDTSRIVVGRYFDWLVRTEEGWRIKHRDTVFDWFQSQPAVTPMWSAELGSPDMLVGTSDESDPFFTRFISATPPPERSPSA